ncbi:hypothetical protein PR202_ga17745 [Eleusine coracana subsp. coracana]|uniref:K-box domain-containing protein n=1 Tax=Eleusine coracana subsp. coracana TaxID=191504 RepID=A0AAV5CQL2_ELECO|nr:hypothetical protein PR202_ga17498 [Eleusine coracana subsp. coracana]GJN00553.1 hypothetical protein PR202_ga17745 [Eleusine coracana subsp. coracana]
MPRRFPILDRGPRVSERHRAFSRQAINNDRCGVRVAIGGLLHLFNRRMNEIIDKYSTHSKNLGKSHQQPSLDLNLEHSKYAGLNDQLAEATLQLRQMRGEELDGLSAEELHQMERKLEAGLRRVLSTKDQLFMQQISELHQKGIQLEDENMRLKNQMPQVPRAVTRVVATDPENVLAEDGQSSESVMTALHSGSSPDNDDGSDTSLKLAR